MRLRCGDRSSEKLVFLCPFLKGMLEIGFEALNFFPRFFSYILFQNSIDSIQHTYIYTCRVDDVLVYPYTDKAGNVQLYNRTQLREKESLP